MPIASRPARGNQSTEAVGREHPLVRGQRLRVDFQRQFLVTALALLLGSTATAFGWRWGVPLLVAAALVQIGLAISLVLLASLQHERALELISERGELPTLEREVRRLKHRRTGLASALEELVQTAERWPTLVRGSRPVFDPRTVRAAATELRAIAACLRTNEVPPRALAQVERLLTSGQSPLYGIDAGELDHELQRIRLELD